MRIEYGRRSENYIIGITNAHFETGGENVIIFIRISAVYNYIISMVNELKSMTEHKDYDDKTEDDLENISKKRRKLNESHQ